MQKDVCICKYEVLWFAGEQAIFVSAGVGEETGIFFVSVMNCWSEGTTTRGGAVVLLERSRATRSSLLQRGRVGERVGVVVVGLLLKDERVGLQRSSLLQRGRVGVMRTKMTLIQRIATKCYYRAS